MLAVIDGPSRRSGLFVGRLLPGWLESSDYRVAEGVAGSQADNTGSSTGYTERPAENQRIQRRSFFMDEQSLRLSAR